MSNNPFNTQADKDAQEKQGESPVEDIFAQLAGVIQEAKDFSSVIKEIEPLILKYLGGERVAIYLHSDNDRTMLAKHFTGKEIREIRVALNNKSIAGYVALNQEAVFIKDAYDDAEVLKIHEELRFNRSYDRKTSFQTKSLLVVPIKHNDEPLGVLQILNKKGGGSFASADLEKAKAVAQLLGEKVHIELYPLE